MLVPKPPDLRTVPRFRNAASPHAVSIETSAWISTSAPGKLISCGEPPAQPESCKFPLANRTVPALVNAPEIVTLPLNTSTPLAATVTVLPEGILPLQLNEPLLSTALVPTRVSVPAAGAEILSSSLASNMELFTSACTNSQ